MVLCVHRLMKKTHKRLKHNKFSCKWRLLMHLDLAILPKKLTQIYHNYLKRPHFEQFFFSFFY